MAFNFLFAGAASAIGSAVGQGMIMPSMGKVSIPNMPTVSDSMVTVGGVSIPGTQFGQGVNNVVNGATGSNVGIPGSYPQWPQFPGYGGPPSPVQSFGPNPFYGAQFSGNLFSFYGGLGFSFGTPQKIF